MTGLGIREKRKKVKTIQKRGKNRENCRRLGIPGWPSPPDSWFLREYTI
jgi:hypothetical protein